MTSRTALLGCLLALASATAGCGVGPGEESTGGAELRVTRDFGKRVLKAQRVQKVREGQTVMRLLRANNEVRTRYGGRFVQAIGGIEGGGSGGFADWFYWVNGLDAAVGAAEYELTPGDVVQWDYRNWRATMRIGAIVGAFPRPFVRGVEGKRFPVRVECEDPGGAACTTVKEVLRAEDVPASGAALGASGNQEVVRVLVARWRRARELPSARLLERGPSKSGVFARFADGGRSLELLDERARTARTAPAGYGLVAALRPAEKEVLWLVTGIDDAGVERAARALDRRSLRDAFAVAVGPGKPEKLPLGNGR
ncbi:MAG: DUF4430 domain-containing protein [Actinomycetota bacterium]|nr:DUF4430 domain-containing protein [Actinomycetota bacterium]